MQNLSQHLTLKWEKNTKIINKIEEGSLGKCGMERQLAVVEHLWTTEAGSRGQVDNDSINTPVQSLSIAVLLKKDYWQHFFYELSVRDGLEGG